MHQAEQALTARVAARLAAVVAGRLRALVAVARDSVADQRTVVEVLSAFARVHSTDPALRPDPEPAAPLRLAVDLHAAVTVLARLPVVPDVPRADLLGANFTGPAALHRLQAPRGTLAHVRFRGADLRGAIASNADLSDADLRGTALHGARLHNADLSDAVGLVQEQVEAARGMYGHACPKSWRGRRHGSPVTLLRAALDPPQFFHGPEPLLTGTG
ncbi:hypothetical protein FAIPA1_50139 [Frankia sp. AiPs1]|uniref:pentapeptide repeat-containing protein n=1 Tax=Frankia sp. AiPa1 TaxID=573492 RepID=UPI00202B2D4F|nr:pentapeptide repeat-containing protein [Frankia sp. AiPa1]MCL9758877.1 pentapeptide repeat-containing protein [Frankia sp. AiPa1]